MSYFFKNKNLIALALALSACTQERAPQNNPEPNLILENFYEPQDLAYVEKGIQTDQLLNELFLAQTPGSLKVPDACDYLDSLPVSNSGEPRFRLVQLSGDEPFEFIDEDSDKFDGVSFLSTRGRVDIAASPLFQYAIFLEKIPSRDEFFDLLRGEMPWDGFALLKSYVSHNKHYIDNIFGKFIAGGAKEMPQSVYSFIRNSIFTNTMKGYLPGIFDKDLKYYSLFDSIPDLLVHNGVPSLFKGLDKIDKTQLGKIRSDLFPLSKNTRLFYSDSWSDFSADLKKSLIASIRGLRSQDPKIEGCSTYLLHRVFSQLVRVKGIDQPPMRKYSEKNELYSSLPLFKDLVHEDEEKPSVKSCARPGVFVNSQNQRMILTEDNMGDAESGLSISSKMKFESDCLLDEALPSRSDEYLKTHANYTTYEKGTLNNWAHLLSGVVEFLTAFNPDAPWWKNKPVETSYPLVSVLEMSRMKEIGGILPLEAHRLAAGMILVSSFALKDHFVLFDKNSKRVDTVGDTAKVILSEYPFKNSSQETLESRLETLVLFLESFLKIYPELETLKKWNHKLKTREGTLEELLAIENFVNGAFKSKDHLNQVIEVFYEPISKYAPDFIYALYLNLAEYMKPLGEKNSLGNWDKLSCYDVVNYRLNSNGTINSQVKTGQCSVEMQERTQKLMNLAGLYFKAPVFRKISRSLL